MPTGVQRDLAIYNELLAKRKHWEDPWSRVAEYIIGYKDGMATPGESSAVPDRSAIINSTAQLSLRVFKAGMMAGVSPPTRPWVRYAPMDTALLANRNVMDWCRQVNQKVATACEDAKLYSALPYVYGEWGSYGTSALGIFENVDHSFRIQRFEAGTYVFSCNDEGVVDIFQYMVAMRASDILRAYPESAPQTVHHVAKTNPVKPFKVLISISRDYGNRGKFPVISRHIFVGEQATTSLGDLPFKNQQLLKESGFYSFPVMVPRWETTPQGDYGVDSPGMLCVSDAAMLQEEERKKYRGLDMLVNPPTVGSANINSTSEELVPGGHTTVLDLRDGGLRPVYEIRFDIAAIADDIRGVEQRIRNSFYVDIFLHLMELGRSARITAEEARMRDAESLLMLSPALDMITAELLTPMFDRILEIMLRSRELPPPPEELQDPDTAVAVTFQSPLVRALKAEGKDALLSLLEFSANLASLWPEVRYKADPYKILDAFVAGENLPNEVLRSDKEAEKAHEVEVQQAQAVQRQQQMDEVAAQAATRAFDNSAHSV